ncbi:MAG: thioredoxin domain-containing protein [Myxococcota bacterium]
MRFLVRRFPFLLLALLVVGPTRGVDPAPAAAKIQTPSPVPVFADDAAWGARTALVTIVAFNDLQCPFCAKAYRTLAALQGRFSPSELRVVHKHFPLDGHRQAHRGARIATIVRARRGMPAYTAYVEAAFANPRATPRAWLRAAGLDEGLARFDGDAAREHVARDLALGRRVGVRGTPAFFINGHFISGARPSSEFFDVITKERDAARELVRRGVPRADVYRRRTLANFRAPEKRQAAPSAGAAPTPDTTTVWKLPLRGDEPIRGPKTAPVTLVVFSEFQCPYCARVVPTLDALRRRYGNDLRLVFKHNPLPFHKRADEAAAFSLEAFRQKGHAGFWAAHDRLFANGSGLTDEDLRRHARALGLDVKATMRAIADGRHDATIVADRFVAEDFVARGTPTFFANGRRIVGAQSEAVFAQIIDEERRRGRELLARGTSPARLYDALVAGGREPTPPAKKNVPAPPPTAPVLGPRGAPVTIQAFIDLDCPYCGRVQPTLVALRRKYGNRIRIVFRHKPLSFHPNAPRLHNAAQEAYRQGGHRAFWRFHDRLWADATGDRSKGRLIEHAQTLGLDGSAFADAIDRSRHADVIAADVAVSEAAGIRATPSFVINGYFISGARSLAHFERLIDRAYRERKNARRKLR